MYCHIMSNKTKTLKSDLSQRDEVAQELSSANEVISIKMIDIKVKLKQKKQK